MDLPVITLSDKTNCAELVTELVLEHYKIKNKDKYLKLVTGLGQGLHEGTLCGAISGGYIAISVILTEEGASTDEIEEVQLIYKDSFKEKYHSINCGQILEDRFITEDNFDLDIRQSRFCGSLLDQSTNEVIELVNLAISAMNPIMTRFDRH